MFAIVTTTTDKEAAFLVSGDGSVSKFESREDAEEGMGKFVQRYDPTEHQGELGLYTIDLSNLGPQPGRSK